MAVVASADEGLLDGWQLFTVQPGAAWMDGTRSEQRAALNFCGRPVKVTAGGVGHPLTLLSAHHRHPRHPRCRQNAHHIRLRSLAACTDRALPLAMSHDSDP